MYFVDFVCNRLKGAGEIRAKKMFGTYNICLNNINLGVLCTEKWYLKKTAAGDRYLAEKGVSFETGVKDNSYIITDFTNEQLLCELARLTYAELKKSKK